MKYRNAKLLKAAQDVPQCMGCGGTNHGNVVAAHANWSEYGKGMGTKAHDWAIAYLCHHCHSWLDEGRAPKDKKKAVWAHAHARTMEWLFETGRLS